MLGAEVKAENKASPTPAFRELGLTPARKHHINALTAQKEVRGVEFLPFGKRKVANNRWEAIYGDKQLGVLTYWFSIHCLGIPVPTYISRPDLVWKATTFL